MKPTRRIECLRMIERALAGCKTIEGGAQSFHKGRIRRAGKIVHDLLKDEYGHAKRNNAVREAREALIEEKRRKHAFNRIEREKRKAEEALAQRWDSNLQFLEEKARLKGAYIEAMDTHRRLNTTDTFVKAKAASDKYLRLKRSKKPL